MTRDSRIDIGILNIAMHTPHSPADYVRLISETYRSKHMVASRGINSALIGALDYVEQNEPIKGITGEIYRFVDLDPNEPWFNVTNKKEASEDEVKKISIPDHLKPHLARFSFVFFPVGHRLYLEMKNHGKSISLLAAAAIFEALLSDNKSLEKFGPVEVTVIPHHDALKNIFRIPFIHQLKIELVRPNPDDHEEEEKKLLLRLEKNRAKTMQVTLKSSRSESLIPDAEIKTLAKVAASNGYVCASGRDSSDEPITRSTKDYPWIERVTYNPDLQARNEVLLQAAARMYHQSSPTPDFPLEGADNLQQNPT